MDATESLTAGQQSAIAAAGQTTTGLLAAQEHLFAALRRPQPTRERRWATEVAAALDAALRAIRAHRDEVEGADGLYSQIQRDAPWAVPRIRQVAVQLARLEADVIDLQIEVARVEAGDFQAIAAVRTEAESVLLSLRDILNKEADLIYERFNEPGALD
jgi:hypothetical protein